MRITNKIMQNNQMYNINQNKIKEDKYATQMATNKKINRASEDPIVAIRALRLRSNVSELTQYYDKNSKDAESWLKVTEDALSNVTELLTSSISLANKGANKDLTTTDLSAIIKEMNELSNEYYSTGNVDYGGRYVFTGYRTDTPLTFTEKESQLYTGIHDGFNAADIDDSVHVSGRYKIDPNASGATPESDIGMQSVGRIRLSYDKLDESLKKTVYDSNGNASQVATNPVLETSLKYRTAFDVPATSSITKTYDSGNPNTVSVTFDDGTGSKTLMLTLPDVITEENKDLVASGKGAIKDTAGNNVTGYTLSANSDGTFKLMSSSGNPVSVINLSTNGAIYSSYRERTISLESQYISSTSTEQDIDSIYNMASDPYTERAWLNTDTGEIILTNKLKERLAALPAINNADTIEVVYNKSQWTKGDIRPDNLFECYTENPNDITKTIHYNGGTYGHTMSYDVGYSQVVDVNTLASDVFTTDVKRSMDDLNNALGKLETMDTLITQLEDKLETATSWTSPSKESIEKELAAAKKAQSYLRDDMQKQLEHKISEMQEALDVANLAVTENGTRSRRLELIQNRLQNQTTTFKTLQSDNEDIDMAETATNLMTAQTVYNAALQATGKISQQSLMNYI